MKPTGAAGEQWIPARKNTSMPDAALAPQPDPRFAASRASISPDHELDWIHRIAVGDRSAFELLFHTYHKRLFAFLFRLVGKTDVAEELTNDVMVSVWKGAGAFKGESKLSTWIFSIAHFRAISWLRRARPEVVDIDDAGPIRDPRELQDDVMLKESLGEEVRRALSKLGPQHREVMDLTFYQEFSYLEIAAILSCPVNTVKTRMFYARKELRRLLLEGAHRES
jgi:RNA polymerase sigma-70 factor, ECF subfamily